MQWKPWILWEQQYMPMFLVMKDHYIHLLLFWMIFSSTEMCSCNHFAILEICYFFSVALLIEVIQRKIKGVNSGMAWWSNLLYVEVCFVWLVRCKFFVCLGVCVDLFNFCLDFLVFVFAAVVWLLHYGAWHSWTFLPSLSIM